MNTMMRFGSTLLLLALAACGTPPDEAAPEPGEAEHGPHGGVLQRDGEVAVELAIFERGLPPEFRAWVTRAGKPVPASEARVRVTLARLGGETETHDLMPQGELLRGSMEVREPHSFDVAMQLSLGGREHRWAWPSHEGRTTISAAIATESGIVTAPVSGGVIRDEHEVQGLLTPIEGRHAHVKARFPGPVRAVDRRGRRPRRRGPDAGGDREQPQPLDLRRSARR